MTAAARRPAATQPADNENAADARLRSLPEQAQSKFERLRRIELRARAAINGLVEEFQRVREQRDDALRLLGQFDRQHRPEAAFTFEDDPKTGGRIRVPTVFPERVALVNEIESLKAELQRLTAEQTTIHPGFSISEIETWLASQSPSAHFVIAPVKLAKGETLTDNRAAQDALRQELATTQNSQRTVAEAKAAMRAQVALLVEKGRPEVSNLLYGGAITWPTEQLVAGGQGVHQYTVVTTVPDAFAFAVWSNAETIIAKLDAQIERMGDDASALTAEAQAARIAELEAALLQLQRQEEAVIERMEVSGQAVKRTCRDPLVLLGIAKS